MNGWLWEWLAWSKPGPSIESWAFHVWLSQPYRMSLFRGGHGEQAKHGRVSSGADKTQNFPHHVFVLLWWHSVTLYRNGERWSREIDASHIEPLLLHVRLSRRQRTCKWVKGTSHGRRANGVATVDQIPEMHLGLSKPQRSNFLLWGTRQILSFILLHKNRRLSNDTTVP
jgi:hypothetical protein